ncbi:hypothetical protein H8E52_06665 [bacterium]|nr:hypothetical protein [bacterium]
MNKFPLWPPLLIGFLTLSACDTCGPGECEPSSNLSLNLSHHFAFEERGSTGYGLVETSEGNFLLLGNVRTEDTLFMEDSFLEKVDANGSSLWRNLIWSEFFTRGTTLTLCSDGGTVAAGQLRYVDNGPSDAFMVKHDDNGNRIWRSTYGDPLNDGLNACIESGSGDFVSVGFIEVDAGSKRPWLLVTHDDGSLKWQSLPPKHLIGEAYGLDECPDGGFIVSGESGNSGFLWRVNSTGETLWLKQVFQGLGSTLRDVIRVSGGDYVFTGVLMTGNNSGKLLLGRTNPDGEVRWFQALGSGFNMDVGNTILEHPLGGFFVAGSTTSFSQGDASYWMLHFDLEGALIWDESFSLPQYSWCHSAILSSSGGFAAIGFTTDYVNPTELWFFLTEPYSAP